MREPPRYSQAVVDALKAENRALAARAERLEAAMNEAAENLEGDVYLHALDSITTETLVASVVAEKERLRAALGGAAVVGEGDKEADGN